MYSDFLNLLSTNMCNVFLNLQSINPVTVRRSDREEDSHCSHTIHNSVNLMRGQHGD